MLSRSNDPHTVDTHEGAKVTYACLLQICYISSLQVLLRFARCLKQLVVISSACLESGNLGTMFLQQFDRPDAMPQLTNEQLFLESLTNKLAAMGTGSGSQQGEENCCIFRCLHGTSGMFSVPQLGLLQNIAPMYWFQQIICVTAQV